jgi:hypothetical protein
MEKIGSGIRDKHPGYATPEIYITEKISFPGAFTNFLSIFGVCRTQDLGRPASCRHVFCLTCIREWAKVCPISKHYIVSINVGFFMNLKLYRYTLRQLRKR